ncbi:hypothetical protein MC885_011451, partial [Smutsia gigantea]
MGLLSAVGALLLRQTVGCRESLLRGDQEPRPGCPGPLEPGHHERRGHRKGGLAAQARSVPAGAGPGVGILEPACSPASAGGVLWGGGGCGLMGLSEALRPGLQP